LLEVIDGLILAGGGDIDPALYDGRPHPTIERVDSRRDALELELSRQALARPLPVLGICRGQQVLAVATGGTLVEHIPDEYGQAVIHRDGSGEYVQHPVEVEADSRLAEILGATELPTPSKHHQAVREVPPEWRVVARAADGVIEALEHRHHPWMIAVQWHPEQAYRDPRHGRLFAALVEAARGRR
ncbi:MAG: gamma-glutamyl-gamma-aminobutyrate hydrolase family protein, partial [Calditrichaeota bacterium]